MVHGKIEPLNHICLEISKALYCAEMLEFSRNVILVVYKQTLFSFSVYKDPNDSS